MANKIDFNKIKGEIDNRKKERNMVSSRLGESVGRGVAPRDEFLNGLITSLHTGKETPSSSLIKNVENTVAAKKGETNRLPVNETHVQPQPQQRQRPIQLNEQPVDMSPERDEQLFADLEKKRKRTLAESIEGYVQNKNPQEPQYQPPQYGQPVAPNQLNEGYLVENVKKIVDNYLINNFGPVVEEAIKSTILEMYAVDRIKEVLNENKDLVKSMVYETLREIQKKNKESKAQS